MTGRALASPGCSRTQAAWPLSRPRALVRLQGLRWACAPLPPPLRTGTEQRGLCIRWAPDEWRAESEIVVYLMPALWISAQFGVEESHPKHCHLGAGAWPPAGPTGQSEATLRTEGTRPANSSTTLGAPASQESWTGASQLTQTRGLSAAGAQGTGCVRSAPGGACRRPEGASDSGTWAHPNAGSQGRLGEGGPFRREAW